MEVNAFQGKKKINQDTYIKMESTVINIRNEEGIIPIKKRFQFSLIRVTSFLTEMKSKCNITTYIHSIKVGIALVFVSLLYLLDPAYKEVGDDNAMWAIMTVVVIFEFYAGATLGKGLNRGIGTVLGGGLGCLTATFAQRVGGIGSSIIVGISVFAFAGAATYCRMIPGFKRSYDYGAMIFILTFNLVAVGGLRDKNVTELTRERLVMILMGFGVCIFTSLFIFPTWASDELHDSLVSRFNDLASSIEECLEEFFGSASDKEGQPVQKTDSFGRCRSMLDSKSKDASLANFAKWEPWHGKFGLSYPWYKYQRIGEVLRELAAIVLSLKSCLQSPTQPNQDLRQSIEEPCEVVGTSIAWTLRELGDSIKTMRRCQPEAFVVPKLKQVRLELCKVVNKFQQVENVDGLALACLVFSLLAMEEKLAELVKEIEELGGLANFQTG